LADVLHQLANDTKVKRLLRLHRLLHNQEQLKWWQRLLEARLTIFGKLLWWLLILVLLSHSSIKVRMAH